MSTVTTEARHDEDVRKRIVEWVKDSAFSYVKFLQKQELYDVDSRYFNECMKDNYQGYMNLSDDDKRAVWDGFGRYAKDKLCNRRHNVVKALKERYTGKC